MLQEAVGKWIDNIGIRSDNGSVLVGEEPLLAVHSAAVAGEGTVGADDAMAGNDDGDGVAAVCAADGAAGGGIADAAGLLGIAAGLAEGDGLEVFPGAGFEIGSLEEEGDGKFAAMPGEIFGKLAAGLIEDRMGGVLRIGGVGGGFGESQGEQAAIVGDGQEAAEG